MLEALEQTDLPNGGRGDAIIFLLQSDLLERYDFTRRPVLTLVDDTISALSKFFLPLVLVELGCLMDKALWLSRWRICSICSCCCFHIAAKL